MKVVGVKVAEELAEMVGPTHVITDADMTAGHTVDWTGRWRGATDAVVRPGSTDEVAAIVEWAVHRGIALVPQGGNTGLVGGSVPRAGSVVIHTARLNTVEDGDPLSGQLTAGAGTTLAAVQQAARHVGWSYGVDLGARDSATIGGTIATNAGGVNVLRHGDTRHQVLGIEAVTGTGAIVGDLRGLPKDNTGYHLPSLLSGSEGTLAIVTRARLRLVPAPVDVATALLACADLADAAAIAVGLRAAVQDLQALEVFLADGLQLVCDHLGIAPPFSTPHGGYVLVEVAGAPGAVERLSDAVDRVSPVADVAVAVDERSRRALWRYRDAHTEAIAALGAAPHKFDVTVRLADIATFVARAREAVARLYPEATTWIYGHAGDGNLHLNVTGVDPSDDAIDQVIYELVAAMGGSISAEHGIGRAKVHYLHLNRTPAEIALFGAVKAAFDPAAILNPGVLIAP